MASSACSGDPDRVVTLRSTVKPFGVTRAHRGRRRRGVRPRAGRDRRSWPARTPARTSTSGPSRASSGGSGISQALLACGSEGMPLDALTAARLARDGEKAGPIRHMCSGQHAVFAAALPSSTAGTRSTTGCRATRRRSPTAPRSLEPIAVKPEALQTAIDGCGVETYGFPLREVARAYAMLADPSALPAKDPRRVAGAEPDDRPRRDARRARDGRRAATIASTPRS